MKYLYAILLTVALSLPLFSAAANAGELPAADGKALWTYVTATNPYSGWGYWPGR